MEVTWDQLADHLAQPLSGLYILLGDELTLLNDAYDSIRRRANTEGFTDVTRTQIGELNWEQVLYETSSQSLFGERRLFDITLGRRGMDQAAVKALNEHLKNTPEDVLFIVRGGTFQWRQRSNKWFKTFAQHPAVVLFVGLPLRPFEVSKWIMHFAQTLDLKLDLSAVDQLATLNEGNLASIRQELLQLALVYGDSKTVIGLKEINDVDDSVADTFELLNSAFRGNVREVEKRFAVIRTDDSNFFALHGALVAKLRQALALRQDSKTNVSRTQREVLQMFLRRHDIDSVFRLLGECAVVDSQAKGIHRGSNWSSMHTLCLEIAGVGNAGIDARQVWSRIDYAHEA